MLQLRVDGIQVRPDPNLLRGLQASGVEERRQARPDGLRVVDEEIGSQVPQAFDLLDQRSDPVLLAVCPF